MKYLSIIPIVLIIIVAALFVWYVPPGGDLISKSGDFILGMILGALFGAALIRDLKKSRRG